MHSVYLDNLDDIDWISPISKIFYAYEDFLTTMHALFHPGEETFLPFLLIGHSPDFCSINYLKSGNSQEEKDPYLLSINIPSILSLAPDTMYGFMLHEIAHYGSYNNDRARRNEAFLSFFIQYVIDYLGLFIYQEMLIPLKKETLRTLLGEHYTSYFRAYGISVTDIRLNDFAKIIHDGLYKLSRDLFELKNYGTNNKEEEILRTGLVAAINVYMQNASDEVYKLAEIMQDIHADVIMLDAGAYEWNDYIEMYIKMFKSNLIDPLDDDKWLLRTAAVFHYCAETEKDGMPPDYDKELFHKQKLQTSIQKLEQKSFLNSNETMLREILLSFNGLYPSVAPVVKYLITSRETGKSKRSRMDEESELLYPDKSFTSSDINTQLHFFLTHWLNEVIRRREYLDDTKDE
jgi:hypothetical protein